MRIIETGQRETTDPDTGDPVMEQYDYQTFINGDSFEAVGAELELRYENPEVMSVILSYNVIDGNDGDKLDGHYNFKYVPKHSFALGMAKEFLGVTISGFGHYWTEVTGPNAPVDAQFSADLNLGFGSRIFDNTVYHSLSFKNVTNENVVFPEYAARQAINEIPTEWGYCRRILYTLKVTF